MRQPRPNRCPPPSQSNVGWPGVHSLHRRHQCSPDRILYHNTPIQRYNPYSQRPVQFNRLYATTMLATGESMKLAERVITQSSAPNGLTINSEKSMYAVAFDMDIESLRANYG